MYMHNPGGKKSYCMREKACVRPLSKSMYECIQYSDLNYNFRYVRIIIINYKNNTLIANYLIIHASV